MLDTEMRWWLMLSCAAVIAGAFIGLWLRKAWWRLKMRRRFSVARHAESQAVRLLEKQGFEIIAQQPQQQCQMWVDGDELIYTLRADYLVASREKTYVAEVKSGSSVNSIGHVGTRRQLLEYLHGYQVDGALLVDVTNRKVQHIEFSARNTSGHSTKLRAYALSFTLGILITLAFHYGL